MSDTFITTLLGDGDQWRLPATEPDLGMARRVSPPAEAFLTTNGPPHIQLGWGQTSKGVWAPVGLAYKELCHGAWITGPMASGKTENLKRIFRQLLESQLGFFALESRGFDDMLALIPRDRESEVVVVSPEGMEINGEHLVPTFNLLAPECAGRHPGIAPDVLGSVLFSFFVALDPWLNTMSTRIFITKAFQALIEGEPHPTLQHLQFFLEDGSYRTKVIQAITDEELRDFWLHWSPLALNPHRYAVHTLPG